jgi:chromatin assembly factor 1 subunit A
MNHHHLQVSPSGSPELTEAASSTPARMSPDPSTPSKNATTTTTGKPAASAATLPAKSGDAPKRRKLTPAEKEAKEKEAAEKKKKREEEEAERKKRKEEEEIAKAARMKEREEQRKQKAEKEKLKLEEKEAKKRKIQEEKDKEARKQPKLKSFFGAPATPKKIKVGEQASNSPRHNSPGAAPASSETVYEKMFQPFFLKEHTTLAELGARMSQETRETKLAILDDFIDGKRSIERPPRFNLEDFLTLPKDPKRGQVSHPPVKHIMDEFFKSDWASGSSMGEASRTAQDARVKLAKVPMKIIAFAEDVRPPYYGTATWKPFEAGEGKLQQLAYNPMDQSLLKLDYGYDSEAEWQEDEEGEDLDLEDDEEDADDEDDMDGFLDDSEDLGPARVMAMNAMEPHCSGLHFEDAARQGCSQETHGFKLEMILGMCSLSRMIVGNC